MSRTLRKAPHKFLEALQVHKELVGQGYTDGGRATRRAYSRIKRYAHRILRRRDRHWWELALDPWGIGERVVFVDYDHELMP